MSQIIVDSREASKSPRIVRGLSEANISVSVSKLDSGDYVLSEDCAIERKTVFDFVKTLTHRELFEQLFSLKRKYKKAFLLLEGYMPAVFKYSKIKPQVIQGALYSIAKCGIGLVPTISQKETVSFLCVAVKQELSGGGKPVIRHGGAKKTLPDKQLFFMVGLPKIGPDRAIQILESYPNPLIALKSLNTWNYDVQGVGRGISRAVEEVLLSSFDRSSLSKRAFSS